MLDVAVAALVHGTQATLLGNVWQAFHCMFSDSWLLIIEQSVAAEVIAALDVDVEALGGRRDIVMPTLEKVRALLDDRLEAAPTPASLRTIGRSESP